MNKDRLTYLLTKYGDNEASPAEIEELSGYIQSIDNESLIEEVIAAQINEYEGTTLTASEDARFAHLAQKAQLVDKINEWPTTPSPVRRLPAWIWAAAAVFVLAVGVSWLLVSKQIKPIPVAKTTGSTNTVIAPGKSGAILTLADGQQIVLDSAANGIIADQAGTKVQLQNGTLDYQAQSPTGETVYNIMTTPKGRQFQIVLPDGTRAWLNAASSLRYPTRFANNERRVEVSGEVYFEVTKNTLIPFKVMLANKGLVEVLGTHFNVKAYDNDASVRVTLLEGKVVVEQTAAGKQHSAVLKPGEQAIADGRALSVDHSPNIDQVMAWKSGLFNFDGVTLQEVMKQLERWYDMEVVYDGKPPVTRFAGEMDMNMPLNDLLVMFREMNIHFKIEAGRKLVVKP